MTVSERLIRTFFRASSYAFALALAFGALAIANGCVRQPSGPPVDAVKGYLAGLPEALHGDTLGGIRPFATEDQLDAVRRYVAYVLHNGERMESTLASLAVKNEQADSGTAHVETVEDWSVVYRDSGSGRTIRVEKYRIHARYTLLLQGGSWLVNDVEELERTAQ